MELAKERDTDISLRSWEASEGLDWTLNYLHVASREISRGQKQLPPGQ